MKKSFSDPIRLCDLRLFWLRQKNGKSPKATAAAPITLTLPTREERRMRDG